MSLLPLIGGGFAAASGAALIGAGTAALWNEAEEAISDFLNQPWATATAGRFSTGPNGRVFDNSVVFTDWPFNPLRIWAVSDTYRIQVFSGERIEHDLNAYPHPAIIVLDQIPGYPYRQAAADFVRQFSPRTVLPLSWHGPFATHQGHLVGLATRSGRWIPVRLGVARSLSWGHEPTVDDLAWAMREWQQGVPEDIARLLALELMELDQPVPGAVHEAVLPFPEDIGAIREREPAGLGPIVIGAIAATLLL